MALPIYATPQDLVPAWVPEDPDRDPASLERLLRAASVRVATAIRFAAYATDDNGDPSDLHVIEALRDATCQQAALWIGAGIDPTVGALGQELVVTSQSVPGGSVSYDVGGRSEKVAAAITDLSEESASILQLAGLLYPSITYM